MNIANYYIKGLPEIGDWRDMHIRIEGNAVNELQDIFLTMWNKSTKQHVSGSQYYPLRNDSTFKGNKECSHCRPHSEKRTQTDEADLYQVH